MEALGGRGGYSFLTSALDRGEWSVLRLGCSLLPGKGPLVPIWQEPECALELVWIQRLEEKSYISVGDRTPVIQAVVKHYTDWATWLSYKLNWTKYLQDNNKSTGSHGSEVWQFKKKTNKRLLTVEVDFLDNHKSIK
jgi:hypothetical protein